MADEQGEKTEDPTPQRREDFRKRGEVAQTRELSSVLMLFASAILMWFLGRFFFVQINDVFQNTFNNYVVTAARAGDWQPAFLYAMGKAALLMAPVLGILWLMSLASSALQVGFLVNEEALQFKVERLDPVQGFQRIFSLRSLMEGIKSIFKLLIVAGIAVLMMKNEIREIPHLVNFSVAQLFVYIGRVTFKLIISVGAFMAVLAGLDYLFQRWDLEKRMRMSHQEVKEEHKNREGDPLIKARIRRVQREMASRRMMEEVPKADVVITNPTHLAVALRYTENMVAPTVVAKGADKIAEKIREIARAHGVPIVENKPLARAMYKTLEIGMSVPKELYTAVAEVLSYVYRLKRKKLGR